MWSSVVQVMACRQSAAEPLPEPKIYEVMSTGPPGMYFCEIALEIFFSVMKIHLKMSAKLHFKPLRPNGVDMQQ